MRRALTWSLAIAVAIAALGSALLQIPTVQDGLLITLPADSHQIEIGRLD
jgi:hypothetical protein